MTHDEILTLLYEETLVGNAPAVKQGVEEGLADGMAALSISGPSFRLGPSQLDHMGALLVEQAAVLSTRLGYPTLERG